MDSAEREAFAAMTKDLDLSTPVAEDPVQIAEVAGLIAAYQNNELAQKHIAAVTALLKSKSLILRGSFFLGVAWSIWLWVH